MLTVCDAGGRALSDIRVRPGDSPDRVVIVSATYPEALMRHYFRGGRSDVLVVIGAQRVQGRIETRWDRGARVWLLRTAKAIEVHDLETAATNSAVPGMRPLRSQPGAPGEGAGLRRVF